jgi:hypothetical protein
LIAQCSKNGAMCKVTGSCRLRWEQPWWSKKACKLAGRAIKQACNQTGRTVVSYFWFPFM